MFNGQNACYEKKNVNGWTYLGVHIGEKAPKWDTFEFSPEIPEGIHEGGYGEMCYALFGTNPSQLRFTGERTPGLGEIAENLTGIASLKEMLHGHDT